MARLSNNAVGTLNNLRVWCTHCGRKCGTFARGSTKLYGSWVCYPNVAGELNCYDLVLNHGHAADSCGQCWTDEEKPPPPKIRTAETSPFS